MAPLLEIDQLDVSFGSSSHGDSALDAVRGVSLTLDRGECLAIVGESGSGKSVTARTLVGLAGDHARVRARRLAFGGTDLTRLTEREWRAVRGSRIGLVLQDALVSLDPLRTVGAEIREALRAHASMGRAAADQRVLSLLADVGVPDPARRAGQYSHQLSGGLRQRALIAAALAGRPELLVADEPTTALDVTAQAQILALLGDLVREGNALLLISHDLAVVASLADRVAVMRGGLVVEQGPVDQVLYTPSHPYTRTLLAAVPGNRGKKATRRAGSSDAAPLPAAPLLEVSGISKRFRVPGGGFYDAVRDVSFELHEGETLGIVGESGSGKTTTARIVLGFQSPDTGSVRFSGDSWSGVPERKRRHERPLIQVIHQDPLSSFDPRHSVGTILGEASAQGGIPRGRRRAEKVAELLGQVGLDASAGGSRPARLSGGQRQRVAIARALATGPRLIVCDEPVSALDVSIQAQVLDLLAALQRELGVALLFISHDLGVIRQVCHRVIVMKDGRVVEAGETEQVFGSPHHPYTAELLAAIPRIQPPAPPQHQGEQAPATPPGTAG
jgi:peptide/nickel transport system ATP-binding protein